MFENRRIIQHKDKFIPQKRDNCCCSWEGIQQKNSSGRITTWATDEYQIRYCLVDTEEEAMRRLNILKPIHITGPVTVSMRIR
jgi:hypothetical protein